MRYVFFLAIISLMAIAPLKGEESAQEEGIWGTGQQLRVGMNYIGRMPDAGLQDQQTIRNSFSPNVHLERKVAGVMLAKAEMGYISSTGRNEGFYEYFSPIFTWHPPFPLKFHWLTPYLPV